jgi:hypothetical protein
VIWQSPAGLDPLANEVALEFGQARHDGAHQLAARCAQVKSEAGLRKHAHLPTMQVVEGLDQVLRAPTPAAQLRYQNGVNLVVPLMLKRASAIALRGQNLRLSTRTRGKLDQAIAISIAVPNPVE